MGFFKNYNSVEGADVEPDGYSNANTGNQAGGRNRRNLFANLNPESNNQIHPMPELDPREEQIYKQLQKIHHIMDDAFAIPCTCGRYRTGLDPIIGLIPGLGDLATGAVSLVLVARAAPVLSKYTTTRMLINVAIDSTVGMIPLLGDAFDFAFQANTRNLAIFEDHMKNGRVQRRNVDKAYILHIVLIFACWFLTLAFLLIFGIVLLVMWLQGKFSS